MVYLEKMMRSISDEEDEKVWDLILNVKES